VGHARAWYAAAVRTVSVFVAVAMTWSCGRSNAGGELAPVVHVPSPSPAEPGPRQSSEESQLQPQSRCDRRELSCQESIEAGKVVFGQFGCAACHSVDGTASVGPTLAGVFGSEVPLEAGQTIVADRDYRRRSIVDPPAEMVRGFHPYMPTFAGQMSETRIGVVLDYLESLSSGPGGDG
jgi:cytochrome c2